MIGECVRDWTFFIELSKRLDKNKFQIVLVGTDDSIDKMLPNSIISIHRTRDQNELAEIYSAADLFVNPTREENYPNCKYGIYSMWYSCIDL